MLVKECRTFAREPSVKQLPRLKLLGGCLKEYAMPTYISWCNSPTRASKPPGTRPTGWPTARSSNAWRELDGSQPTTMKTRRASGRP